MKKRVMGLDASTTTIGLAIIDVENTGPGQNKLTLTHLEYYKPPKKGDIITRLSEVRQYICDQVQKFKPDEVALEDIILFMKGHSTAATTSSLAVLNRTVGLAAMNATGKVPHLFNVMRIRHTLKLTPVLPSKEDIPELVAKRLGIDFPYQYNKKAKSIVENHDMADAVAVALTFILLGPPEAPKKKVRKKKKDA
jgi:Holliday junction resolvasome RuvABC endonuclease subunit